MGADEPLSGAREFLACTREALNTDAVDAPRSKHHPTLFEQGTLGSFAENLRAF